MAIEMQARVAEEIELEGWPGAVELVDGRVLVLAAGRLFAVDGDRLMSTGGDLEILELHDGWVRTSRELVDITGTWPAIPLPDEIGGDLAAFRRIADGALLTVDDQGRPEAAAVLRLDAAGAVVWRAAVAPPPTIGGHVSQMRRETGFAIEPMPPWKPETWIADGRGGIEVSGDRVLAIFVEMPRSGIGIGYGMDLATGEVVFRTRPGPHGELAAAPTPGQFLVGLQGYDAFETQLVDRDGAILTTWASHGRLAGRDPLRLVELRNTLPSTSHMATLHPDGRVHRGAHLPAYYTSSLVTASDGSILFWRDDALLRASADGERLERLVETPRRGRPHAFLLDGRVPGRLGLGWTTIIDHPDRLGYEHRLFLIDVE